MGSKWGCHMPFSGIANTMAQELSENSKKFFKKFFKKLSVWNLPRQTTYLTISMTSLFLEKFRPCDESKASRYPLQAIKTLWNRFHPSTLSTLDAKGLSSRKFFKTANFSELVRHGIEVRVSYAFFRHCQYHGTRTIRKFKKIFQKIVSLKFTPPNDLSHDFHDIAFSRKV